MSQGLPPDAGAHAESSLSLLERARAGDTQARDILIERYLPRLQRWATGRMPHWVRDGIDTQDLVQDAVILTFRRIENFEARGEGSLLAYLRQAVMNRIRDLHRRSTRRPTASALDQAARDPSPSPLEEAVGREAVDRYERALARLSDGDRQAIIARVEMDASNEEIAKLLDRPTPNAARMAVERALVRLAREMQKEQ
jgi:RNA polymerase sigma-70 factor, ECF subfamily